MDVDSAPNGVNGVLNTRVDAGVLEVKSRSIEVNTLSFFLSFKLKSDHPTESQLSFGSSTELGLQLSVSSIPSDNFRPE